MTVIGELGEKIDESNRIALERILNSDPVLVDIQTAGEWLPDMHDHLVLHAGPPISWDRMPGSTRGAVIGALLYEGMARTTKDAERLAASGEIEFRPNHRGGGVGGMTGIITRSTPLYIIENRPYNVRAYAGVLTDRLIFGGYDRQTLDAVRWTNTVFAPALKAALKHLGGVNIKRIQAEALHMNDEMHNRSNAATALFSKAVAPALVEAVGDRQVVAEILRFWNQTPSYFTFIGMGACKATMLAAADIPYSSIVTVMARNGVEFGVQVSGLGDRWFTGEAAVIDGPTFPGYSRSDAERDIGDSCITETAGIGAFVMAGAPAILRLVGGTVEEAHRHTAEMYEITVGENPHFTIPALDFQPGPVGIDIRKVIETGIVPVIDTAMTHRSAGVGEMIGAGMVTPPMKPFQDALRAFFETYAG
ncbi:MAG TPA: hypothetical protein DEP84_25870 [Chloroflexi bacterium]|nr:hypothetical protein [Chloroflexota bacterium]